VDLGRGPLSSEGRSVHSRLQSEGSALLNSLQQQHQQQTQQPPMARSISGTGSGAGAGGCTCAPPADRLKSWAAPSAHLGVPRCRQYPLSLPLLTDHDLRVPMLQGAV